MTREEAKRRLLDIERCTPIHTREDARDFEALEMAIQALSREPISLDDINNALGASFRNGVRSAKVEQEPCEDAISRKAVEEITWEEPSYTDALNVLTEVRDKVRALPSVTQKSGKWINDECGNVICSECKRFRRDCRFGHTNYCNHCGAKMEREEISERNMKMWEEIFKAERSGK